MKPKKTIMPDGLVEEMWRSGEAMMNEARLDHLKKCLLAFKKLEKENKQLKEVLKEVVDIFKNPAKNEIGLGKVIKRAEKILKKKEES